MQLLSVCDGGCGLQQILFCPLGSDEVGVTQATKSLYFSDLLYSICMPRQAK